MILTLAWKEYREHRAIWLTMVVMTGLMGLGLVELVAATDTDGTRAAVQALTVLGMAAAYGVVCGAMMFAGEREAGTLVFLDIFLGRRGLLWFWKVLLGAVLAVTEALAVALSLHLLKQAPAPWLPMLVGSENRAGFGPGFAVNVSSGLEPATRYWFLVLPAVTLEAYCWGLLGSTLTRRVLSGAGVAVLMTAPVWLITILSPAPVSLALRLMAAAIALFFSLAFFLGQSRDVPLGPAPRHIDQDPRKRRLEEWDGGSRLDLERRALELDRGWRPDDPPPPVRATPGRRRREPVAQARSSTQALFWLTLRQAWIQLIVLAGVCLVIGLFVPAFGQVLWPVATLLLGVLCGTAAFSQEQNDLSYQFLAAQHLPLKKVWRMKIGFWLAAAVLLALVMLGGGGLAVFARNVFGRQRQIFLKAPGFDPPEPEPPMAGFEFGTMGDLLGPLLFFPMWLAYGFVMGQVFVLFCRKTMLALLLATLTAAAAIALWLPSLLCGGTGGLVICGIWVPSLLLLAATRFLIRPWAGGRIKDKKPMAAIAGFSLAGLAWALVSFGYRAWEIPDVGEPMDRDAYRTSVPLGRNRNPGGQKILEAIGELELRENKEGPWLARMDEAARLPIGMIENPLAGSRELLVRHLEACGKIAGKLRGLAAAAQKDGKPGLALDRLSQILYLSRTLRNKASMTSYLAGVATEAVALDGLDLWLIHKEPAADLLRRALDEMNRHAAGTPAPLDCLRTECYRAGEVVDHPVAWGFFNGRPTGRGQVPERWVASWIAFSLDVPWELERRDRLWRAVWAGLFRTLEAPPGPLPQSSEATGAAGETTRTILRGWSPGEDGLSAARLARLLDSSWLADERLFAPVLQLRAAATRARWRVDACRLRLALALYRKQETKTATRLEDLIPKYLPELPRDPYTGRTFHYRVSVGETIAVSGGATFQGRTGRARGQVKSGQGILWSTGPDGIDDGGRKHGGHLTDEDPQWSDGGQDLVTVVEAGP
jgi:hypothetical protein